MLWGIIYFVFIVTASFGFAVLMNFICKKLLYPFDGKRCVITVIPLYDSQNDIEAAVAYFVKHCELGLRQYIIILYDGTDDAKISYITLLTTKYPNVLLCNGDNLYSTIVQFDRSVCRSEIT